MGISSNNIQWIGAILLNKELESQIFRFGREIITRKYLFIYILIYIQWMRAKLLNKELESQIFRFGREIITRKYLFIY